MKEKTGAWMEFAERDLSAAEELSADELFSNIVLFHCQQCIEKSLKALYEENEMHIPRIHSTFKLFKDLNKLSLLTQDFIKSEDLIFIDDVYLDTRYPGGVGLLPSGFPTIDETTSGLKIARYVFERVSHVLG